jgi:ribonucleoside-diphosphate reductase alpha chain
MEYPKGYWINSPSRIFLSRGYLLEGQTVEQRLRLIAERVGHYLEAAYPGITDKVEDYQTRGWLSNSSPIWSNFGTGRALPISCNGSYMDDRMGSILLKTAEIGEQTKQGAGTSIYMNLRGSKFPISGGGFADGPVHFTALGQEMTNRISQGNVRRGNTAYYYEIEHPDILDILEMREEGHEVQQVQFGLCISDQWMQDMLDEPIGGEKKTVWARVIRKRFETGYPFIFWKDAVNEQKPQILQDLNIPIYASNLCTEIMLPSNNEWSFVCDLLSVNLLHFDEWKNTDLVEVACLILDAVLSEYIEKIDAMESAEDRFLMMTARNFAEHWRAIGVGVLGYHSYLQHNNIALESFAARQKNLEIFSTIDKQSLKASKKAAKLLGEAPGMKGTGLRWLTRHAIAPTTSSSFILGQVSRGIEPFLSNYYTEDLAKGKFPVRNAHLQEKLRALGKDTDEVWESILLKGGSVQHLDFLDQHTKNVFKTFGEVSQAELIEQAIHRTPFIDQGQSLNIRIHPKTPPKAVHNLMVLAWKGRLKSMYYQRSTNPAQEYSREQASCVACEA